MFKNTARRPSTAIGKNKTQHLRGTNLADSVIARFKSTIQSCKAIITAKIEQ